LKRTKIRTAVLPLAKARRGSSARHCASSRVTDDCTSLPPVEKTEDYLDLIAGIETTAHETGLPVVIGRRNAAARSAPEQARRHA